MRTRTVIAASALLLATLTPCGKSDAEKQADCQKAINKSSTKTHRPDACKGISQDDYETLLMAWALDNAINDMPKEQRDLLDYSDDGKLNGSIGGESPTP